MYEIEKTTHTLNILKQFSQNRISILLPNNIRNNTINCKIKSSRYLINLLNIKVTKLSIFSDDKWDFNEDYPNVSPNVKGSKLTIDFQRFENIPESIIIELKCIMMFILLTPDIFINNRKKSPKSNAKRLAPNTIIGHIKSGCRLLNTLFNLLESSFGKEHIKKSNYSVCSITANDFRKAATVHENSYNDDLKQFFSYIHNPHTSSYILGETVKAFEPDNFNWKVLPKKRSKQQVIPNLIFEKLVRTASCLINDFLVTLDEEVADSSIIKYTSLNTKKYCEETGLNKETFNIYRAHRLLISGYSEDFISKKYQLPSILKNSQNNFSTHVTSEYLSANYDKNFNLNKIYKHLNLITNAAKYIIGQYTGMRPSDLSLLQLDNCLVTEGSHTLLKGHVLKGTESLTKGLFDDKWVVIPIMRDAIKALSIISTITQRKMMFSSSKTKKTDQKEIPMNSVVIRHQLKSFIKFVSPKDDLGFSNYMMRHTLAYQLYRLEAGLPLISFQLKHLVNTVDKYLSRGSTSDVTFGYGGIADILVESQTGQKLRKKSEIEVIKATADPDGTYIGGKASEHKERLKKVFEGYMASGYSREDIFDAMAEQGIGVINVGLGYCYGADNTDDSLPCIGSLKCNPNRCSNAIVSKANAPHWRDVYVTNRENLNNPIYQDNIQQIKEVMNEAKNVLELLGEGVIE
jgi:integrase